MKRHTLLCSMMLGISWIVLPGCSSNKPADQDKPSFFAEERASETAQVTAINPATRVIGLKADDGREDTFVVDRSVRNLDQVKVGDRVSVDYHESLTIKVLPPGEAMVNDYTAAADRAEPGQKPGGTVSQHLTLTATVTGVDKANRHVTLRGPAGNLRTVSVKDPKKLENISVGDVVRLTYTEMIAVAVTPAGAGAAASTATPPAR